MFSLKINNSTFPLNIKSNQNYISLDVTELSKSEFTKVNIILYNKIEIIKDNKIIKEFTLIPIIENYEELLYNMKNNDIHCNVDIYEELIPIKYIVKKINNNLYYDSFSFLLSNNIEK
jgi:hypothetical protein